MTNYSGHECGNKSGKNQHTATQNYFMFYLSLTYAQFKLLFLTLGLNVFYQYEIQMKVNTFEKYK